MHLLQVCLIFSQKSTKNRTLAFFQSGHLRILRMSTLCHIMSAEFTKTVRGNSHVERALSLLPAFSLTFQGKSGSCSNPVEVACLERNASSIKHHRKPLHSRPDELFHRD